MLITVGDGPSWQDLLNKVYRARGNNPPQTPVRPLVDGPSRLATTFSCASRAEQKSREGEHLHWAKPALAMEVPRKKRRHHGKASSRSGHGSWKAIPTA